ncbi:MAG: hypothetical protein R3B06_29585 [Kofleriaceae bacterium]
MAAAGCVGTLDPAPGVDAGSGTDGGNTNSVARGLYITNVFPIMQAKCGGCHTTTAQLATPFVGTSSANAYEAIVGFSSVVGNFSETGAPVYTKVFPGGHQGQSYVAAEQTKIKEWLAAEVQERATNPNPNPNPTETPGQATARIISEWSGCLKESDFIDIGNGTGFGEMFSNKGSNEGNCEQCHTSGAYGFLVNDDNTLVYNTVSTNKYYMLSYFAADLTDLANPKMVPNFANFERVGQRMVPHQDHPQFNTDRANDPALLALQTLYDRTMGYKTAGTCGTPRIPQ